MIYFQKAKDPPIVKDAVAIPSTKVLQPALLRLALSGTCLSVGCLLAYVSNEHFFYWGSAVCSILPWVRLKIDTLKINQTYQNGRLPVPIEDSSVIPNINYLKRITEVEYLCKLLSKNDFLNLSLVDHACEKMASEPKIWLQFCKEIKICNQHAEASTIFWKDAYVLSKKLKPRDSQDCDSFLIVRDLTFVFRKPAFPEVTKEFEVWRDDQNLASHWKLNHYNTYFEMDNQVVYICGLSGTEMLIFSYDLNTREFVAKKEFRHPHGYMNFRPLVVFSNHTAFHTDKDGIICEWDLNHELYCKKERYGISQTYARFDNFSLWSDEDEAFWQSTFTPGFKNPEFYQKLHKPERDRHFYLPHRKKLALHTADITALKVKNSFLFSAAKDQTLRKWDLSNPEHPCVLTISTELPEVDVMQITNDSIFALYDKTIKQWNLQTGELKAQLELNQRCDNFLVSQNHIYCSLHSEKTKSIEIYNRQHKLAFINALYFEEEAKTWRDYYALQVHNGRLFFIADKKLVSIRVDDNASD